MNNNAVAAGKEELLAARRESRGLFWAVAVFSAFANLLMLTGPLYMLQVYDRVLGSRSYETLLALTLLVAFLYGIMGILDFTRSRVLSRIGARFQSKLDRRVFDAVVAAPSHGLQKESQTGLSDLESVQRLMASPVLSAFFDIPWTPVFLIGIAIFHPWLGYLAVGGGAFLILVSLLNQRMSRRPQQQANGAALQANLLGEQLRTEAEMVQSLGMRDNAFDRWNVRRTDALAKHIGSVDVSGTFTSMTKTFRLFLQSAMLGLGAYLVLEGELSPGAMIAGSILLGRALAPIELMLNQWALVQRASSGWNSLAMLLGSIPAAQAKTALPKPKANLDVQAMTIVPPGESQAALKLINFSLKPGEALGVIGPSGAGKSSLARAITNTWRPAGGKVRLDGATLDQYDRSKLGEYIGYLPQRVQLFEGTIAENIARLSTQPDAEKIVAAAKKADAHDMIIKLPDGYDTHVKANGGRLSGGQIQRIGLARALYSDPVLLVLDEPNSNLDNSGGEALNNAIRAMKAAGNAVVIMAHRPAAIQECNLLLMIEGGAQRAFGPRDEVLQKVVSNHSQIQNNKSNGGVQ